MLEHHGQQGPGKGDHVEPRRSGVGVEEKTNAAEIFSRRPGDFLYKAEFLVWRWG